PPIAEELLVASIDPGQLVYEREGSCITCHQENGRGLSASGFPPLANSDWVSGNKERLIKLTLKGLHGPIKVNGRTYPGQVPMMAFEGLLSDEEVAAVLSYVRRNFGNNAVEVTAAEVEKVRAEIADRKGFYSPGELLSK
ncbi:MAG: cytochrome c, partial [Phaeodactylibacter sp.]|nr:cytochrome c [Phaeodactylibacter sp.]